MKLLTYTMFFVLSIMISSSKLKKTYSVFDIVNEKIPLNANYDSNYKNYSSINITFDKQEEFSDFSNDSLTIEKKNNIISNEIELEDKNPNYDYIDEEKKSQNFSIKKLVENLKMNLKDTKIKDLITEQRFLGYLTDILTGNSFISNLNVLDLAIIKNQIIKENLQVNNEAFINKISFNQLNSKSINITDNEIILDPEANLKMTTFPKINFKIKDIFEVLTFMKYLNRYCGPKLSKCDLKNLLLNKKLDLDKIINKFEIKLERINSTLSKFIVNEKVKKVNESFSERENFTNVNRTEITNLGKKEKNKNFLKNKNLNENKFFNNNDNIGFLSIEENKKHNNLIESLILDNDESFENFMKDPKLSNIISNYYYNINE